MSYEHQFYRLPLADPLDDVVNFTTANFSHFYCSGIPYRANMSAGVYFRLNSLEELNAINSVCHEGQLFTFIMTCITMALGIPGNTLAIATMMAMPKSTGTFYILVLAVSDLLVLISTSIKNFYDHYERPHTYVSCQASLSLINCLGIYANWILVLVSVERFITVRFPLKKRFYFTGKRARISVLVLAIVMIPIGIGYIISIEYDGLRCVIKPTYNYFYMRMFKHFIIVVLSFLPAVLIFSFSLLVTITLRKHQKERGKLLGIGDNDEDDDTSDRIKNQQLRESKKVEMAITIMMCFAFLFFLLVSIPVCVIQIVMYSDSDITPIAHAKTIRMHHITKSLYLLSRALNFYIYFLSGRKFRSHLCGLLKKCTTPNRSCRAANTPVTEMETM